MLMRILESAAIRIRGLVLRRWLGAMGSDCHVEFGVRFRVHEGIRLEDRRFIGRNMDLHRAGRGTDGIDLGNDVRIREGCYLDAHGGWIQLAERVFLGPEGMTCGQGATQYRMEYSDRGRHTTIIRVDHAPFSDRERLCDQGLRTANRGACQKGAPLCCVGSFRRSARD
jgi:hypothetical protein